MSNNLHIALGSSEDERLSICRLMYQTMIAPFDERHYGCMVVMLFEGYHRFRGHPVVILAAYN